MLKILEIKPLHNMLLTTMEKYTEEELKIGGIIDASKIKNPVKEYQKVIAIGSMVRNIAIGDIVMIDPSRYAKRQYHENSIKQDVQGYNAVIKYELPVIEVNDKNCLLLYDNDIKFVITKYKEEEEPDTNLVIPEKKIIV